MVRRVTGAGPVIADIRNEGGEKEGDDRRGVSGRRAEPAPSIRFAGKEGRWLDQTVRRAGLGLAPARR